MTGDGRNFIRIRIKVTIGFANHGRDCCVIESCGRFIDQLQAASFILHNDQIRHIVDDQLQKIALFTQTFSGADPFGNVADRANQPFGFEWTNTEFGSKKCPILVDSAQFHFGATLFNEHRLKDGRNPSPVINVDDFK